MDLDKINDKAKTAICPYCAKEQPMNRLHKCKDGIMMYPIFMEQIKEAVRSI